MALACRSCCSPLLNSALAVTIASTNVTTRMWYSMARSGALPRGLAKLSSHKTPVNALLLQTVISLVVGLGAAALIGPRQSVRSHRTDVYVRVDPGLYSRLGRLLLALSS